MNSAPAPLMGYHAHVYFDADTIDQARALCEAAARHFGLAMGRVHAQPVGPHPDWSCQLGFRGEQFGEVLPWLNARRAGLTVFVHPVTGDQLADHRDFAVWLGHSRPLDLSLFDTGPQTVRGVPGHVTLRPVTRDNFEAVTDLELLPHQADYLASNSYSIAQASFYPHLKPRAVYADETLVGFMMYAVPRADGEGEPGEYGIWRFMVDAKHQGGGLGRRALGALLDEIRAHGDARRITISYMPDNTAAQRFYASFGFVERGIDDSDEMVALLDAGAGPPR
jgi:diamine N-acetyltransferase